MDIKFDSYRLKIIALVSALVMACAVLAMGATGASAAESELPPQQLSTPTATQGSVNLPTATPTQPGGPTATVTRTPTTQPVIAKTFGDPITNLRSAPTVGDDRTIVASLQPGTELFVVGRWLGYDWYLVKWDEAPGGTAWVHGSLVTIIGDETTVPAVTPPPAATADPAQETAAAMQTEVVLTPGGVETATAQAVFAPTGVFTVTPAGGVGNFVASVPTFTAPAPYNEPDLGSVQNTPRGGVPPAVVIVSLGGMGLLTLIVGLIRRI